VAPWSLCRAWQRLRDNGAVRTKAVYLAIGVNMEGHKEVLGLWISQTEGAKFWLQVACVSLQPLLTNSKIAACRISSSHASTV
jgi:hypothetical protein